MQNAVVSFKELCGLSPVANLMQCILAVSMHLVGPDNTPLVVVNLSDQYPTMELQGIVPEVLKKIVTAYEMVSSFLCLSYIVYLKEFLNIYVIYCTMPALKTQ